MANSTPSFLAILVSLAGGFYVGRSVFPQINPQREIARRVEILSREVSERASSGLGTKLTGAGMERVPEVLAAWKSLTPQAGTLPEAPPPPTAVGGNLTTLMTAWEQAPAGASKAAQAADVGTLWGRFDPAGALAWADALKDASEQSAAHQGLAKGWAQYEPFAASEWVAAMPEGAERTAVVSAFAKSAGKTAPMLALAFGLSIEDAAVRAEVVHSVLKTAAVRCPAEAETILKGADLSAAEHTDFLSRLASFQSGGGDQP